MNSSTFLRVSGGVFLCALTWQAMRLPDLREASGLLKDTRAAMTELRETNKQAQELIKDGKDSWDDIYFDLKANAETTAVVTRNTSELIGDLRAGLVGGTDSRGKKLNGVLPEVQGLVSDLRTQSTSLSRDLHELTGSLDEKTLEPLRQTLNNVASLTATLEEQVKTQSPGVSSTISSLNQTLVDLDKLVADPNIQRTLANVETATYHTGETIKTLDAATRPLRKKANQVVAVLKSLLSIFKVTLPIP